MKNFLNWRDNYLTVASFAKDHCISEEEAQKLLEEGRREYLDETAGPLWVIDASIRENGVVRRDKFCRKGTKDGALKRLKSEKEIVMVYSEVRF